MRTQFLQSTLTEESRAYGFTIAFWGSGALLIKSNGLPVLLEALSYGFGAVLGFGLLVFLTYSRFTSNPEGGESQLMALSMVHYIASLLPIVATYYLAELHSPWSFLTAGLATSILYNLGMVVEELLAEKMQHQFSF